MPSAGPWAGRLSEVAISTDGVTYTDIERIRSPKYSGSVDTVEVSSNDSSGYKEYIPTWVSATLTFEMVADETAAGQELLWGAFIVPIRRFFRLRPKGNTSTEKEIITLGMITSIEESMDVGDRAAYSVTVQLSGQPTRQNQT